MFQEAVGGEGDLRWGKDWLLKAFGVQILCAPLLLRKHVSLQEGKRGRVAFVGLSFLLAVVTPIKATWVKGFILTCGVRVSHGRRNRRQLFTLHASQEAQADVGAQPTSSVLFSLGLQLLEKWGLPASVKAFHKDRSSDAQTSTCMMIPSPVKVTMEIDPGTPTSSH